MKFIPKGLVLLYIHPCVIAIEMKVNLFFHTSIRTSNLCANIELLKFIPFSSLSFRIEKKNNNMCGGSSFAFVTNGSH